MRERTTSSRELLTSHSSDREGGGTSAISQMVTETGKATREMGKLRLEMEGQESGLGPCNNLRCRRKHPSTGINSSWI